MKRSLRVWAASLLVTACFCNVAFSKSKKEGAVNPQPPMWLTDEGRYQLFPKSEYVSYISYGSTESEAKNKAAAGLSAFIKSTVSSIVQSRYEATERNGETSATRSLSQESSLQTENTLYQLEYTAPYYSAPHGMYACLAYIKRETAFSALKPKLDNISRLFSTAYRQAQEIKDDFEKIIALEGLKNYQQDFYQLYDFVLAINPESAVPYAETARLFGECSLTGKALKRAVRFRVESVTGSRPVASEKVQELLTAQGFVITEDESFSHRVSIQVATELSKTGNLYITYPFITVAVYPSDKSGGKNTARALYTKSEKLEKCAAYDEEGTLRRADKVISAFLESTFLQF